MNLYASGANWNTAAHWGLTSGAADGSVPTSADDVIFDANSVNMQIDTNAVFKSIDSTGYTATLTQNTTRTMTSSGDITWVNGTFAGGDAAITVNGNTSITGGTFTSTSGILDIGGAATAHRTFTVGASATFNHNNGTIQRYPLCDYNNITTTIDVPANFQVYNLIYGGQITTGGQYESIFSNVNGGTIVVNGYFKMQSTGGVVLAGIVANGGTISLKYPASSGPALVIGEGAKDGTSKVSFTGNVAQEYHVSGSGRASWVDINTTSTVAPASGITELYCTKFSLTAGTFTAPSVVLDITHGTDSTSFTVSAGTTFTPNGGAVQFVPDTQYSTSPSITIDVPDNFEFYDLNQRSILTAGGSGTVNYVVTGNRTIIVNHNQLSTSAWGASLRTFTDGTYKVLGNYTLDNGSGGTAKLTFSGGNTQTITINSGTITGGLITVNKSGGSVVLAQNTAFNTTGQDLTVTAGTLDLAGYDIAVNDVFTIASGATLKCKGNETITAGTKTFNANMTLEYYDAAVNADLSKFGTALPNVKFFGGKTHTFVAAANYTSAGTWQVSGGTGKAILTASATWNLDFTGTSNLGANVDVKNSDASGGDEVSASGSTDSGGNTNWDFGGAAFKTWFKSGIKLLVGE